MSVTDRITDKLNSLESFAADAPAYLLPLKAAAWLVILLALMLTNLLAIIRWPFSALTRRMIRSVDSTGQIVEIASENELKNLVSRHEQVLVDFWAQWCGPCLLMNKAIEEIAGRHADELVVAKVDASLNSATSRAFGVRGLPTIIIFRNAVEINRYSGALTVRQLSEILDQAGIATDRSSG